AAIRRRPLASPPFPYTTLFRSPGSLERPWSDSILPIAASTFHGRPGQVAAASRYQRRWAGGMSRLASAVGAPASSEPMPAAEFRSEEHTSELQSRENLVCRLLL